MQSTMCLRTLLQTFRHSGVIAHLALHPMGSRRRLGSNALFGQFCNRSPSTKRTAGESKSRLAATAGRAGADAMCGASRSSRYGWEPPRSRSVRHLACLSSRQGRALSDTIQDVLARISGRERLQFERIPDEYAHFSATSACWLRGDYSTR